MRKVASLRTAWTALGVHRVAGLARIAIPSRQLIKVVRLVKWLAANRTKNVPDLDVPTLMEYLEYDHETGLFHWLVSRGRVSKGHQAGQVTDQGYILIRLLGKNHKAHRLAWFYTFGVWPEMDLDHINRDRTDNRLCNLRSATRSQNLANSGLRDLSTSGLKGAYWEKRRKRWYSNIKINMKNMFLGYFENAEAAHAAYVAKAKELRGEFARAA